MRILFDQGTPRQLRSSLRPHTILTTLAMGWDRLTNSLLLDAAEREGFEIFITTDKNLPYQQNLKRRKIAIIVLQNPDWADLQMNTAAILDAIKNARPGTATSVEAVASFGTFLNEEEAEG